MNDESTIHVEVKDYKVKVVHPSDERSEAGRFERAINIDGECFHLNQPEFLVRLVTCIAVPEMKFMKKIQSLTCTFLSTQMV